MPMYVVSWKIDMEADTPLQAAESAQALLQGEPVDWVYEVTEWGLGKSTTVVDLEHEHLEEDENARNNG